VRRSLRAALLRANQCRIADKAYVGGMTRAAEVERLRGGFGGQTASRQPKRRFVNSSRGLCLSTGPIGPEKRRPGRAELTSLRNPQPFISSSAVGIPIGKPYRLAKRPPRRSRWRPSHFLKGPDGLRRLAPQPRFVATHALKQGGVKIGEAQETLGDGAGFRPWCEWVHGGRQRLLVAGHRIVSSVRAREFAMAIGPGGSLERLRLTGSAGRSLPACRQKFAALELKQAGFDRTGTTKSPQQAC